MACTGPEVTFMDMRDNLGPGDTLSSSFPARFQTATVLRLLFHPKMLILNSVKMCWISASSQLKPQA